MLARAGLGWRGDGYVRYRAPVPGDPVAERVAAAAGESAPVGPIRAAAGRALGGARLPARRRRGPAVAGGGPRHPSEALATNWTTAWVGFDILMASAFVVTAVAARRRSPIAIAALAADAAILVCDGWFDSITANGRTEIATAVASALLIELPLAVFSLLIARRAVSRIAAARVLLARAGAALPR